MTAHATPQTDDETPRPADIPAPSDTGVGPCRHCGRTVEATATECRFCGYQTNAEVNRAVRFSSTVYGLVLVATVIGAPLGVVFLWRAYRHHRALTDRVVQTAHAPPPSVTLVARMKQRLPRLRLHRRG